MPNDPKGQNNRILAGVLKFAVPAVFVLGAIWVTSLFEPDPIDLDKAIDEAYEVAEIDLAYLR